METISVRDTWDDESLGWSANCTIVSNRDARGFGVCAAGLPGPTYHVDCAPGNDSELVGNVGELFRHNVLGKNILDR